VATTTRVGETTGPQPGRFQLRKFARTAFTCVMRLGLRRGVEMTVVAMDAVPPRHRPTSHNHDGGADRRRKQAARNLEHRDADPAVAEYYPQ
jgi:hypothetical protein